MQITQSSDQYLLNGGREQSSITRTNSCIFKIKFGVMTLTFIHDNSDKVKLDIT